MMVVIIEGTYSGEAQTMTHTHVTAPTQYVEVDGDRSAHRRFDRPTGTPPAFIRFVKRAAQFLDEQ